MKIAEDYAKEMFFTDEINDSSRLKLVELLQKVQEDIIKEFEDSYFLIGWPESQDYMEEDWFEEETILAIGSEDKIGSSAYFIPVKRILNLNI
jgi:hypothetical protein